MSVDDELRFKAVALKRSEKQKLENKANLDLAITRGSLAVWLSIIVVLSIYFVYLDYARLLANSEPAPDTQPYVVGMGLVVAVCHLVGAVGLLCSRLWGFYCIAGATAVILIFNALNGVSWLALPTGLLDVGVVYFMLRAGGSNCLWRYLK